MGETRRDFFGDTLLYRNKIQPDNRNSFNQEPLRPVLKVFHRTGEV